MSLWMSLFQRNLGIFCWEFRLKPESDGQYQLKTRFSKFTNLPELMSMFKECADIRTADVLTLAHTYVQNGEALRKNLCKFKNCDKNVMFGVA